MALANATREWYRFQMVAADPSVVDIQIIDAIGSWDDDFFNRLYGEALFGITARAFVEQLAALPAAVKAIHVHINSPGGDVQGSINIANALRDQQLTKGRSVEAYIDGMAASAASIVAMAGGVVHMADNALMMIHKPVGALMGTAKDMRAMADALDTVTLNQIIKTYNWHSSMSTDEIGALMDAETWMDADMAIANGFATDKVEGLQATASISPIALATLKVPEKFKARVQALLKKDEDPAAAQPAAAADILARVSAAGLDLAMATALVALALPLDQVDARIASAKAEKVAAVTRANDIRAICATAKQSDLAETFITGGLSVEGVRAILTSLAAKLDQVTIDGTLKPDSGTAKVTTIDTAAVYAARNK